MSLLFLSTAPIPNQSTPLIQFPILSEKKYLTVGDGWLGLWGGCAVPTPPHPKRHPSGSCCQILIFDSKKNFGLAPLSNRGEHVYYSTLREKMNDLYYCFSQDKNQLLSKKILINNQKSINIKNKHRVSMRTPYSETHTELSTNGYNAWRWVRHFLLHK